MALFRKSKNRKLRIDSAHKQATSAKGSRVCRFETMEPRQFLAADLNPITIGSVYYEDESGFDDGGDLIEITFNGGAAGTQLSQIVIDTDKVGDGATIGDTFFDLAPGGEGAFNSRPLAVVSSDGIDSYDISVADGGQLLVIDFTGFDAGEKIVLSLDVDEFGFIGANAVAEGNEWEGSKLNATFVNENYFDATGGDIYLDAYDSKLAGTGLNLPPDNYIPPSTEPAPVRTAGAVFELKQTPLPITIAGTVFEDFNQSNLQDSGDQGIANVHLDLLRQEGDAYVPTGLSTTTDANGDYLFTGDELTPGTYRVVETQPDGYLSVGARAGTVDGLTVGLVESVDVIAEISLVGGDDSIDNDFAEFVPASIQGRVHVDRDGDCDYDEDEPLLAGVTIQLFDDQGILVTTTQTDANGEYLFEGLHAGTYTVVEQQPNGYFDGGEKAGSEGGVVTDDRIAEIVLTAGAKAINYDFCELEPSSIAGRVHVDRDGDCLFDEDEPAIAGVTMRLYNSEGELVSTAETDENGVYRFDGLPPGTYTVAEEQPAGYFDGGEKAGSEGGVVTNDRIAEIVLAGGTAAINYDFCELEPSSISGRVHAESDGDCEFEEGETLLEGVTIRLYDAEGELLATTETDENGEYRFDDLAPGTYTVVEEQPAGYFDGGEHAGSEGGVVSNDRIAEIVLTGGTAAVRYDFCELVPSSISGRVHAESDGDCEYEDGETLLEGVTIRLYDAEGELLATTKTDENGGYRFDDLAPGTYTVVEEQPAGYFDGGEHAGSEGGVVSNDRIAEIVLTGGTAAVRYDFCELEPSSISGRVHADRDGDCNYDEDEPTLAGVTIRLFDQQGSLIATTQTDENGQYLFEGLAPGSYTVAEEQPAGYFDGGEKAGSEGGLVTNDRIAEILLTGGTKAVNYDFCELEPSSISGRVHADNDGNCVFTEGDTPLAGVTIDLLNSDGEVIATTETDDEGRYLFDNLEPNLIYTVRESQPAGYFDGEEHVGSVGGAITAQDVISEIFLGAHVTAVNYDFCEVPPATLSGFVFQDGPTIATLDGQVPANISALRDGLLTSDDTRLSGVVVELRDGQTGQPIMGEDLLPGTHADGPVRTTTNSAGYYEFTGLPAGDYAVYQVHPDGYIDYLETVGTLGGTALNHGATISSLEVDPASDAIVGITLVAGQSSEQNNFSEIQVSQIPIIPDPDPTPDPVIILGNPIIPETPPTQLPIVPETPPVQAPLGSGRVLGFTWHLSVVDAGLPRNVDRPDEAIAAFGARPSIDAVGWRQMDLSKSSWLVEDDDEGRIRQLLFGLEGATPVAGDFNGDGVAEIGVFYKGEWFIDINGNGVWDEEDLWAQLGEENDRPVVGDWDGDGKTDIGIFGPVWPGDPHAIDRDPGVPEVLNDRLNVAKNMPPKIEDAAHGTRQMKRTVDGETRADLIDHVFHFGGPTDMPLAGDWSGDGIATIATFNNGTWHLDIDGDGRWDSAKDSVRQFGQKGDVPVVGDWAGKGKTWIGVYRDGKFILDSNGNGEMDATDRVFAIGAAGDKPISGDWDGDGQDEVAVYRDGQAIEREARLPATDATVR